MPKRKKDQSQILETARKSFGFESLRPGQEEAIQELLAKRDVVVVQPTGAGKSAIYQIAGLMIKGVTVIISPLIALQKDQVDSINEQDAADAVVVNSTQRVVEVRETAEKIESGDVEYIFLAPEQLRKEETLDLLERAGLSLFVVDEAHCISEWGHDFRPDYLQLGAAIKRLGHPVVLAMTATASPDVRDEIIERLGMREPKVFVHGFDRPNIYLRVDHFPAEAEKLDALVRRVHWADKPGIVYVATRKNAEAIMRALKVQGVDSLFYHGGLKAKERDQIQQRFMSGDAEVIVATNAFGMGVDKADVRFVYHFDVPESLDAYYQEIGRAGRDGEKSEAVMFFRPENIGVQKFRTGEGKLDAGKVREIAEIIAAEDGPVKPDDIADKIDLSDRKLATALHRLEDVGAVEVLPTGELNAPADTNVAEVAQAAADKQKEHQDARREKLRQMEEYADSSACRRQIILRYFGDDLDEPCGNCDNCERAKGAGTEGKSGAGTRREVVA